MTVLLTIGFLLIIGYSVGWLLETLGLPKILGYILTGFFFSSSYTTPFIAIDILVESQPLMDVCLGFIAFEVGGELKWSKIKTHEKEIISITILASILPFILITLGIFLFDFLFPTVLQFDNFTLLTFALLLGVLASPTAPAATIAVMHQYKARGKVSETIMGVAALDDVLGILLFSMTIGAISIFSNEGLVFSGNLILEPLYKIFGSLILGASLGGAITLISKWFKTEMESRWVVIIFSLLILCVGLSQLLHFDYLLSCMAMGAFVVNFCKQQKLIFKILARYTEDLIFLLFFLLSGLHLDISALPIASSLIAIFVILRIIGKYIGANIGARIVHADRKILKYTAGGLLPQAGIVIGLVLSIHHKEQYNEIYDILLATIMGATVINEFLGPITAKYSLKKSGEIKSSLKDPQNNTGHKP